jgi:hypothetical protein
VHHNQFQQFTTDGTKLMIYSNDDSHICVAVC